MSTRTFALAAVIAFSISATPLLLSPAAAQEQPQEPSKEKAKVEPVDFKKLKDLLPDAVGALKRTNAEGGKQSIGEMKLSQARGTYGVEDKEESAGVTIIDYGAMPGMAESAAPWANMEVDNESDTDYSRTVTIATYKGLENYNKESKSGTLLILVASRFLVSIEVNALPPETMKATAEGMKLNELAALAK